MTRHNRCTGLLLACLSALGATAALPAGAQNEQAVYQIEVIVFRHTAPATGGEIWTPRAPPAPNATLTVDDAISEEEQEEAIELDAVEALPIGRFERMEAQQYALQDAVAKLSKASRFSPLVHTGWLQPVVSMDESMAQYVNGSDEESSVSGKIVLSRGRYMHLDFDLTLVTADGEYRLRQKRRRVQSRKNHYIDHPYFSVIVQFSPRLEPETP